MMGKTLLSGIKDESISLFCSSEVHMSAAGGGG